MVEYSGISGMYSYTDALCEGLSRIGADVTVLTSSAWPEKIRPFKVERQLLAFTSEQGNFSKLHWATDRFFRSMVNINRRNKFAVKGNFDVVHIQGASLPLLDQFFLKPLAKNVPVVLTVHDVRSHYERFVNRDSFIKRNLQIPHRLIVHYENGGKQLAEHWKVSTEKIAVIPHGIILAENLPEKQKARVKLDIPTDRPVLLFFGSIRPNKGLDVLLAALEKVRSRYPKVLLIIAGAIPRGMSFEPYSDIIKKLNFSENVKLFIGFVPDDDVDYFMSACDIVVLPYSKFEAQSGVLLRAYAHEKPVVVTNTGAMGELVSSDKVGLVVEPGDKKSLAEAIINVLDNPEKFRSCYNPKLNAKYDWGHIAELTLQSYEKVIENRLQRRGC